MHESLTAQTKAPLVRVGLFSIGLDAYWPQFPGLQQQLLEYNERIAARLQSLGAEPVNLGLIDNPLRAREAGHRFRASDVDILFLHVTTYALSSTVLARGPPRQSSGHHPESRTRRGHRLRELSINSATARK